MKDLDLSIVIVNYNSADFLEQCLNSVYQERNAVQFETFVVDNNSFDNSCRRINEMFPQVNLIMNKDNLGFARANNQAIGRSRGRYILLLNPDAILKPEALGRMIQFMDRNPEAGAAGARLLNPDGTVQLSCRHLPSFRTALFNRYSMLTRLFPRNRFSRKYLMTGWNHNSVREIDWVSGACLIIRREALNEVGLLDERFFMYAEDVDWCYRAKQKGWKVYFIPQAEAVHYIGQSSQKVEKKTIIERHRSMYLFYKKHYQGNFLLSWLTAGGIAVRTGFLLSLACARKICNKSLAYK